LPPLAEIRDLEQLSKSLGLPLEDSDGEAAPEAVALEAVLGIEDPGAFEREADTAAEDTAAEDTAAEDTAEEAPRT
jgi:hypothetical protein